ncbi:MAG: hypothetical protein FWD21_04745 [Peptococcaceae bacterium]|nr:hypothetical protein [Peptococcaceae bacterium]
MGKTKYDFYVAGRTRNAENIRRVVELIRKCGKTCYCFLESSYDEDGFAHSGDPNELMNYFESLGQNHPLVDKVFKRDIEAEKQSHNFLLVLPAGISGQAEAGIAYGLGKKLYLLGKIEKPETLYGIFDKHFLNEAELEIFLKEVGG